MDDPTNMARLERRSSDAFQSGLGTRGDLIERYRNRFTLESVRYHWNNVANIYDGENRKFGYTHLQRFHEALEHVQLLPAQRILDVFTRTGNGIRSFKERCPGITMVGMELSEGMLRLAQKKIPGNPFVQSSPHLFPFRDNVFDIVLSLETLEHVPSPLEFLLELHRIMKPGARLVMSLPPATAEYTSVISDFLSIGHGEGPHRFLSSAKVKEIVRIAGFNLLLHKGTVLLPVGPEVLKRWVDRIEHVFQGTFIAEIGIRQFYICEK